MYKHILRWVIIFVMIISIVFMTNTTSIDSLADDTSTIEENSDIVDQVIFPHNEVVDVNIVIDEDNLALMNESPLEEQYYEATIEYNGYTINDIAVRTKGNSSLTQVASSDSERYSLKVDFNYYISNQSFLGITKLNLNNIFSDDTLMAEYMGYEMLDSIDAEASRTTYVSLSINGEYHGLYLAVEEVNETFLADHYEVSDGALYKPETEAGADLVYIDDDMDSYTGVIEKTETNDDGSDFIDFVKEIQNVLDGDGDLSQVFDVDSFLKYLAVSTATIHMDSYQSGMNHNYYLYNNDGVIEWISWDLNMIFNGFPQTNFSQEEAINFLIDEPVYGSLDDYDLIEAVFMNEVYVNTYHEYLQALTEGYLEDENFETRVLEIYDLIKSYASIDPTAFATIDVVEDALFVSDDTTLSLIDFMSARVDAITSQLSGESTSTNNGEGNIGSEAGNGQGQGQRGQMPEALQALVEGKSQEEIKEFMDSMTQEEIQALIGEEMPEGMEAPADGQMPEGVEAPADGQVTEGIQAPADDQRGQMGGPPGTTNLSSEEEELPDNPLDSIGAIAGVSLLMALVIAFMKRR